MPEFRIELANEDNMKDLSSVQKALMGALNDELLTSGKMLWISFMPGEGVNPLDVYFCPLKSTATVGAFKMWPDGTITNRSGVGHEFLE